MIIPINDTWRIATDQYQYIVQVKKTPSKKAKNQEPRWQSKGYYTSPESAVKGLLDRDLRLVDEETLADALERNKQLRNELEQALKPIFELKVIPLFDIQFEPKVN